MGPHHPGDDHESTESNEEAASHPLITNLETLITQFEGAIGGFTAPPLLGGLVDDLTDRFPRPAAIKSFIRSLVETVVTNEARIDDLERSLQEVQNDVTELQEGEEVGEANLNPLGEVDEQLSTLEARIEALENRTDERS